MSGIGGVSGAMQSSMVQAAQKQVVSAAKPVMRDADGDYDGTPAGQVDARDFGKGMNLDRRA